MELFLRKELTLTVFVKKLHGADDDDDDDDDDDSNELFLCYG